MPGTFVILGAGHFGRLAVTRIAERHPQATITVVDEQPGDFPEGIAGTIHSVAAEGVDYLTDQLPSLPAASLIVPAIPVHVAFEWLLRELADDGSVDQVPVPSILGLPNETVGPAGDHYVSHADFRCPDDCPEPKKVCPVTQADRGTPMFRRIADLSSPSLPAYVIRSEQLAPGVGGYPAARLTELRHAVMTHSGTILVGTACSCHGVISALRRIATAPGT